jgi:hypothetical protein
MYLNKIKTKDAIPPVVEKASSRVNLVLTKVLT